MDCSSIFVIVDSGLLQQLIIFITK